MTQRDLAALICKALSIYSFLNILGSLNSAVWSVASYLNPNPNPTVGQNMHLISMISNLLFPLLGILAACFLWLAADNIAAFMVKENPAATPSLLVIHGPQLQNLVFAALGVFILAQAIPRAMFIVSNLAVSASFPNFAAPNFQLNVPDLVELLMQFLLGFYLLLGASDLVQKLSAPYTSYASEAETVDAASGES